MIYKETFQVQSNDRACTFHDVTKQVKDALFNTLLANCDDGASKFLVEIK